MNRKLRSNESRKIDAKFFIPERDEVSLKEVLAMIAHEQYVKQSLLFDRPFFCVNDDDLVHGADLNHANANYVSTKRLIRVQKEFCACNELEVLLELEADNALFSDLKRDYRKCSFFEIPLRIRDWRSRQMERVRCKTSPIRTAACDRR
jgi:hypothetical protein